MYIFIIITLVLSLKALCERDRYKCIACNPIEVISKEYSATELRRFIADAVFKIFCLGYELIFYIFLFYHIRNIFVLAFAVLHWGVFIQDLPRMIKGSGPSSEKEWDRRVAFAKVWAACEVIFLSYLLYSLKNLV